VRGKKNRIPSRQKGDTSHFPRLLHRKRVDRFLERSPRKKREKGSISIGTSEEILQRVLLLADSALGGGLDKGGGRGKGGGPRFKTVFVAGRKGGDTSGVEGIFLHIKGGVGEGEDFQKEGGKEAECDPGRDGSLPSKKRERTLSEGYFSPEFNLKNRHGDHDKRKGRGGRKTMQPWREDPSRKKKRDEGIKVIGVKDCF